MTLIALQGITSLLSLFALIEGSTTYSILWLISSICIGYAIIFHSKHLPLSPAHQAIKDIIMVQSLIIMPSLISYQFIGSSRFTQSIYIISLGLAIHHRTLIQHKHKPSLIFPRIIHIGIHVCTLIVAPRGYQTACLVLLLAGGMYTQTLRRA